MRLTIRGLSIYTFVAFLITPLCTVAHSGGTAGISVEKLS